MLASPALYNVGADYMEGDAALLQKRCTSRRDFAIATLNLQLIRAPMPQRI
jgi:hypothetical protein